VKTTMLPAVVALGWLCLLADVQALAQNGAVAAADAKTGLPAAQNSTVAPAASNAQTPANGTGVAPNGVATDPTLIDNGLWEGASVGPGCSKCGGGAQPPDWYTLQGTRIISRSQSRRLLISEQRPATGTYTAVPVVNSTEYQVLNDIVRPVIFPTGALDNNLTTPTDIVNTKQMGLGVAAGYDMTIGHYFCRDKNNNDHFVEFHFWGLNSWSYDRSTTGYFVPIYDEADRYTAEEAAQINVIQLTPTILSSGGQQAMQGSLRTTYPLPQELLGATPSQQILGNAFNHGIEHDVSYRSAMNDFEINGRFSPRGESDRLVLHPNGKWQRECQPGTYMSYLYGLRFMQIDETFKFHSHSQWWDQNLAFHDSNANYDIYTHNSLLGLQVGADMTFRKCRWAWGIESKFGPHINFANQQSTIDALEENLPGGEVHQRMVANRYAAALVAEVGFQATYKFRPTLMGRAAYDFMWISGVALAPEQLQMVADPIQRINANGSIFSQGVSLGLEWMW
jgi:hypothetical protein